jgi:hypothetical protein
VSGLRLIWHNPRMRSGLVSIAALVSVLVAGCTAGGSGSRSASAPAPITPVASVPFSSTAPATPPPSPSPSRTGPLTTGPGVLPGEQPPVLDQYAKAHTQAGALAFAAYYYRALDWSIATNDPYLLAQISAARCPSCERYISAITALRKRGGAQRGGRIRVRSEKIVTRQFDLKSDYVVQIDLDESAAVVTLPSSAPSTAATDATYTSLVFITWSPTGWQIMDESAPS